MNYSSGKEKQAISNQEKFISENYQLYSLAFGVNALLCCIMRLAVFEDSGAALVVRMVN